MYSVIVKTQKEMLALCLLLGLFIMCYSCSSSEDENEVIWNFEDCVAIDKYKDFRILIGTEWNLKLSEGYREMIFFADKTCRCSSYIEGIGFFFPEGVWEYNSETGRLVTTVSNFPKLTLNIYSSRDMIGYTDDGKMINATIANENSTYLKFRDDDVAFDFLVGKWRDKNTGTILIIHANGEYQIKNQITVDNGIIEKWVDWNLTGSAYYDETLLSKENKALAIELLSGNLMEMKYMVNLRIEGETVLCDEIKEFSGSYEYVIDD